MSKDHHDNVIQFKKKLDSEHYIKAAQTIISSIILGNEFDNQLEIYEKGGPEGIENEYGIELVPYAFEMEIVKNITEDILNNHVCKVCLLEESIEIDDPYVRRRVYRTTIFLLQNWESMEKEASNIASFKPIKTYYDEPFVEDYFLDMDFFGLDYIDEPESGNKEEHMLN